MFWYSNQDLLNKNWFSASGPGLVTHDRTVVQVYSALPLSSKSSSTQELYRDTVETQAHVCFNLFPNGQIHYLSTTPL